MSLRTGTYLALDILLLAFCGYHAPSLLERARLPFDVIESDGGMKVADLIDRDASGSLHTGDIIESWKGQRITDPSVLEFLGDFERIGSQSFVQYQRGDATGAALVTTISYYSVGYLVLVFLIGVTSWIVGIYVLLRKPGQLEASVLHWGMMCLCTVVILAWQGTTPGRELYYVSPILFFVSYIGVAATFFFFTSVFPRQGPGPVWLKALLIYTSSALALWPVLFYHSRALFRYSAADYIIFEKWFDVFHVLLFLFIAGAIINFIISFFRANSREERRKIKWLVFGFCTGPTPFILLTLIPMLVAPEWTVSETYTLAFLIFIPITCAISIIQHHILDVETVIQRTTAYALVIVFLLVIYLSAVAGLAAVIGSYASETYAISAVLVGLLFEPARRRVQHLVDRSFFRVHYNFRETERSYVEEIRRCLDMHQLAKLLVHRTDELISVERIGFFVLHQPGNKLRTIDQKGFELFERRSVRFEPEKLATRLEKPVALSKSIEPGVDHEAADPTVFHRWHMAIVFPMLSKDGGFLGFLVLGDKKAGTLFTGEDVDLLRNVATQAGLMVERIMLQKELILKQAETERLAELNALKSDFVSYVSHELRTPLTSIKLFTELLKERGRGVDRKGKEFIRVIEGEAERLNRMVSTILDSAEIEHGVKEFNKQWINLGEVAQKALGTMTYQLKVNGFEVHTALSRRAVSVLADPDAVLQAIINLIANSIKYSSEMRYLNVRVTSRRGEALCSVMDHGLGIPGDTVGHIFEPFYRGSAKRSSKEGVGLGLPLVKRIIDAHGGRIEVQSKPGEGSTFTLVFPQAKKDLR